MKKGMVDKIQALWNVALAYGVSCWAYFQPVHHMLSVLLIVLAANLLARIVKSIRGYKLRRSRKRKLSIMKWLMEVRLVGILYEFAISCFIVMVLCMIYKTLESKEEDASIILEITKYGVYVTLVAYTILLLNTIGQAFPDTYIVRAFKIVFKKLNIFKSVTSVKDMPGEILEDINEIVEEQEEKENGKKRKTKKES